jgi:hypothetical protein
MTSEQLAESAEQIVHGRVVRSWTAWDRNHKYIWTHYEIAVSEILRGARAANVIVSEPGGTLDGVSMQTSGSLPFTTGEETMLFLYRTPIGYWRTVGGPQGKFAIDRDRIVRSGSAGVLLVDGPGNRPPGQSLMRLQELPVNEFLMQARKLAAAHPYRRPR